MLMRPLIVNSAPAEVREAWRARFQNRSVKDAPKEGDLRVVNAKGADAEMMLYDEIGFWGVTASQFKTALDAIDAKKTITLRINSPGGEVFDGLAIYNALKARTAPVNVVVDGVAASAASFVAMAGSKLTMSKASFMMIHKASGLCMGNDTDMVAMAGVLGQIDGTIADIYAGKTGKPAAAMLAQMGAETWFTAAEAVAAKMADEVDDPDEDEEVAKKSSARARLNMMRRDLLLAELPAV